MPKNEGITVRYEGSVGTDVVVYCKSTDLTVDDLRRVLRHIDQANAEPHTRIDDHAILDFNNVSSPNGNGRVLEIHVGANQEIPEDIIESTLREHRLLREEKARVVALDREADAEADRQAHAVLDGTDALVLDHAQDEAAKRTQEEQPLKMMNVDYVSKFYAVSTETASIAMAHKGWLPGDAPTRSRIIQHVKSYGPGVVEKVMLAYDLNPSAAYTALAHPLWQDSSVEQQHAIVTGICGG